MLASSDLLWRACGSGQILNGLKLKRGVRNADPFLDIFKSEAVAVLTEKNDCCVQFYTLISLGFF